jgi:levanase/fructan beta-fructosidase
VLLSPPPEYADQIREFRDPGVFWHAASSKWVSVISLAQLHKLLIYTSDDLKEWELASEFGPENAVGGVWECPSLFPLPVDGDGGVKWVAQVGLNPGGPPGTPGSGTQYFVGDFDGTTFTADPESLQQTNWLDWGPDFYAALSFSGLPDTERVDIAWMNNWKYGGVIPTDPWRSAMSIPRKLSLEAIDNTVTLVQSPVLEEEAGFTQHWDSLPAGVTKLNLTGKALDNTLTFTKSESTYFGIIVQATADLSEQTRIGYDFTTEQLFVNRTLSGVADFDGSFPGVYSAPLPSRNGTVTIRVLSDWSSVEVFGGQGEVSITAQIFPSDAAIESFLFSMDGPTSNIELEAREVHSVW